MRAVIKHRREKNFGMLMEKYMLEVGCGGGKYKFMPKIAGDNVVYIDIDKPSIKIKNFIRADACFLPFRKEIFTDIFASHVIEHLNNLHRFLQCSHFCLISEGKLHIWCPNFLSSNAKKDPTHISTFNFLNLREILKQHGFRPIFQVTSLSDKMPKFFSLLFKILILLLCNDLHVVGIKKN